MRRAALKRKMPLRAKHGTFTSAKTTSGSTRRSRSKRRLTPLKTLKRKAWEAFSRFIRTRDPRCVCCGDPTTEAGHYRHNSERKQDLGGNALWYDPRNVHGQCGRCNRWLSGNLTMFAIYLEQKYGDGILQEFNDLWRTPKKWTREEVETVIARFTDDAHGAVL